MSRSVIAAAALCAALLTTAAQADDRDRKAKAALALAAASSPEKCECAKARIRPWKDAVAEANARRVPIVVFAGDVAPRCCSDAIPVKLSVEEARLLRPEKPIVIYIPTGDGKVIQATDLPANATTAEIKTSVELAKKLLDKK